MTPEQASAPIRTATGPKAQVISLGEVHGDAAHRSTAPAHLIEGVNPLHAVRARLHVCVGEAQISVGELLAAKEHQVLVLDRSVDQPVDLLLEGKVVARGQLIAIEGRFAIRITELPVPLRA